MPFCTIRRYKRQKSQKGIRGPDTPPVSPSAWPAQPAGLTPRRRASPPPQRHPAPCLAADRGALTARRPWAVACPCRLRRLRVPSNNSNRDGPHCGVPSLLLSARLRRIISRDIYIIYIKVGWVAYRTILLRRGLDVMTPGKAKDTPAGTHPHVFLPWRNSGPHASKIRCLRQRRSRSEAGSRGSAGIPCRKYGKPLDFLCGMV